MKQVHKTQDLDVTVEAPPAKAYTLRALLLAALAEGTSTIRRPLLGEDQLRLVDCLRKLGVSIEHKEDRLIVEGAAGRFSPIAQELDVGESGVAMNFLTSAACLSEKPVTITGAPDLVRRPIHEVVSGARQLGCEIAYLGQEGFPPIRVSGGSIAGGLAKMHGAKTSQYFSSVAISAPYAASPVTLRCLDTMSERPYFDITLQMMAHFGVEAENQDYEDILVPNTTPYMAREVLIEGDYSSASFFFLAGAICGSRVTVRGLNRESKQGDKKMLRFLEEMGCRLSWDDDKATVEGAVLHAIDADMADVPDLAPPLAIAVAFAEGTSRLLNVGRLRFKECDRLEAIIAELGKMEVRAWVEEDALLVKGNRNARGARINPHNDHRIAMSFAAAGLVTGGQAIENEMCVRKSFPDFWERFRAFGATED